LPPCYVSPLSLVSSFEFLVESLLNYDYNLLNKSTKYEKHADQHPDFNGSQTLRLWKVLFDGVDNVEQRQEEDHQQGHPGSYHVSGDHERDPGYDNKEAWQI
jgi:hypothetical protein